MHVPLLAALYDQEGSEYEILGLRDVTSVAAERDIVHCESVCTVPRKT